jgi:hypothetical protein
MDPFGNDEIARLLRLKRYEQPPPAYFENFLHEFRRRQRDELLRQPPWRIWFERAQGVALRCLSLTFQWLARQTEANLERCSPLAASASLATIINQNYISC